MSDFVNKGDNVYTFWNNHTSTTELESPALSRQAYNSHTIYIENPDGVGVKVQVSPGVTDKISDELMWHDVAGSSTDTQFTVHTQLNCKYIRVVRTSAAGAVTAVLVSGGLSHL